MRAEAQRNKPMAVGTSHTVFSPVPSLDAPARASIDVATSVPAFTTALGLPVAQDRPVPDQLGVGRAQLEAAGFDGKVGSTLALPSTGGPVHVAVGLGDPSELNAATLRDAAASFARAAGGHTSLAMLLPDLGDLPADVAAQAVVEGVLLARYRYDTLRREPKGRPVDQLTLLSDARSEEAVRAGVERGRAFAGATMLARDLANTPHSHLSAARLADLAVALAKDKGFTVEVFDKDALVEMGCGGLLGVNAGSVEPPRMIKLTYRPEQEPTGHLTLVGKGIMFDSGGISLKPGDEVHAMMKNDMSGAADILAAVSALAAVGCPTAVTGYLMCTDNMPSGTAQVLGDVLTVRGGTTVEVINTDAEGRLVMADALVLATEEPTDAIVDIATLTGASMRALGTQVAGLFGNHQGLVDQVKSAAEATDEPVWQLPLDKRYRSELDSPVADLRNVGGANAGAITAALFLAEFVGDVPWAHIDIAGTAQTPADTSWHTEGCSGFGARLLLDLAVTFQAPTA